MIEKKVEVFVPKALSRNEPLGVILEYIESKLKAELKEGWKIGGVFHSKDDKSYVDSEIKLVVLYK